MWPTKNPASLQQAAEAVTILLAGLMPRVNAAYTVLAADARDRVTSFATDPKDLAFKITSAPEALLLDATIYPGPKEMIDVLTRYNGAAYVILPPEVIPEIADNISKTSSVKGFIAGMSAWLNYPASFSAMCRPCARAPNLVWKRCGSR